MADSLKEKFANWTWRGMGALVGALTMVVAMTLAWADAKRNACEALDGVHSQDKRLDTIERMQDRYTGSDAKRDWAVQNELNTVLKVGIERIGAKFDATSADVLRRLDRIEDKVDKGGK